MRYKVLLMFLAFLIQSCDRQPSSVEQQDELLGLTMTTKGKIENVNAAGLKEGYEIEKGNENIFIYRNKGVTFKDHVDYEATYKEELVFEVDPSLEEFEYKDEDLRNINAKYHWILYSKDPEVKRVDLSTGKISGRKLGPNEWEVSLNINTGLSFGSFLDKKSSHKIEVKEKVKTTGNPKN